MLRTVSEMTRGKALAAGDIGRAWLEGLDVLVDSLEIKWNIRVGEGMNGGSHAFVAPAEGEDGAQYVLKVELPDNPEEEFLHGVHALELADGHGYAKLYAFDAQNRACLMEKLGGTLRKSGIPPRRQMEIICDALHDTWRMPATSEGLTLGGVDWFRDFLPEAWESTGRPCCEAALRQALSYLDEIEREQNPEEYVLLHGDAHNNNTLESLEHPGTYKLIDPDGLFYEKAYDLGVLMREWPEEYRESPLKSGRERCAFLAERTGVPEEGVWRWGFLQMIATGLLLVQIGAEALGREMLGIAEKWCE